MSAAYLSLIWIFHQNPVGFRNSNPSASPLPGDPENGSLCNFSFSYIEQSPQFPLNFFSQWKWKRRKSLWRAWPGHIQAVSPWKSHFTSLGLSCLIWKMGSKWMHAPLRFFFIGRSMSAKARHLEKNCLFFLFVFGCVWIQEGYSLLLSLPRG